MDAMILAIWLAVPLAVGFGAWLFWHKVKRQQRLRREVRWAQAKAVDARLARIEEMLELQGRSTPLHFVTYDAQVVRLLLAGHFHGVPRRWRGEDPNARDEHGETPLHWAARGLGNCYEAVQVLLEAGAKPNARTHRGETPLHLASRTYSQGRTSRLAHTPEDAAWPENFMVIRLLLEVGADPNARDEKGRTPLHRAIEFGNGDAGRLLTEGGADMHARDEEGATPLHLAAEFGRADYAKLLLKGGADVNAEDREGATPLYWAVAGNGASRDFDARAGSEERQNRVAVMKLLLEAGADPDFQTGAGDTPREAAVPVAAALLGRPSLAVSRSLLPCHPRATRFLATGPIVRGRWATVRSRTVASPRNELNCAQGTASVPVAEMGQQENARVDVPIQSARAVEGRDIPAHLVLRHLLTHGYLP